MKRKLIIFFLLLTYFSYSQVDSIKVDQNKNEKTTKNIPIEKGNNSINELDYYKLLSEQSKNNNDTYISLIQWTLGVSFGFLLAIIGSQIFFNYRINKKEVEYIKKDVDEKIADLKNELNEDIDSKFNELKKELKIDISANISNMKDEITSKFKSEKEYSALKLEVMENSLQQEIKILKKDIENNAGNLWKLRGVESNALSSFIRAVKLQIELGREPKYLLDDIIKTLNGLEEIHKVDHGNLETLVEQIKTSHKDKSSKIKELYIGKPIYYYGDSPRPTGMIGMVSNKIYIENKK